MDSAETTSGPDGELLFMYSGHGIDRGRARNPPDVPDAAPTITSISPNGITAQGSTTITITGSGFASGYTVTLSASGGTPPYQWSIANSTNSTAILAQATRNPGDMQPAAARSVAQQPQLVNKTGWYALDVGDRSAGRGLVEVEFVPDDNGEHRLFTLKDSGNGGQQAAWMHFNQPGSLIIRASGAQPALRGMDYGEFISRFRDITLSKAVLTVFLLEEVVPLTAWILIVWWIRALAYKRISTLPRTVRTHARMRST